VGRRKVRATSGVVETVSDASTLLSRSRATTPGAIVDRVERVGELELEQDPHFQRLDWRLQRAGWGLMLLLIVSAASGLLGRGPLARTTIAPAGSPLTVEYNRLIRHGTEERLTLRLDALASGEARVTLDSALLSAIQIRRLTPRPVRVETTPGGAAYTFALAGPSAARAIIIDYVSERYWRRSGTLALNDRPPLPLSLFIFP
jgi:hypothetical protein